MIAILSATENDLYAYPLPIVVWSWYKIGIKCVVFTPERIGWKIELAKQYCDDMATFYTFNCEGRKEATYAQTSRLFGATVISDEFLITGDSDLAVFGNWRNKFNKDSVNVFGYDLLNEDMKQYPMCFIGMPTSEWQNIFCLHNDTLQTALDDTVGKLESQTFRGDFWGYDQWLAYESINRNISLPLNKIPRARPGTQFAANRVDRDDVNWRAYVNDDLVDAHLWRPGYTDENFANILELMQMKYPQEDFTWLVNYNNEYKKLL